MAFNSSFISLRAQFGLLNVLGELVPINSAVSSALALPAVTSNAPDGITKVFPQ
jgi:hypothetical protein